MEDGTRRSLFLTRSGLALFLSSLAVLLPDLTRFDFARLDSVRPGLAVHAPLVFSLHGVGLACSSCDPSGRPPLRYTGGHSSPERGFYETNTLEEDMLHFPPGRVYELEHGLGTSSLLFLPYISFTKQIVKVSGPTGAPSNIALASGNEVVIEGWDEQIVRVRNDTCAEFYLRVVVTSGSAAPDAGG